MLQRIEALRHPHLVMVWGSATIGAALIGFQLSGILSGDNGINIIVAGVDLVLSFVFYPFGMLQFIFLSLMGELTFDEAAQITPVKILGVVVAFRRLFDLTFLGRPLRIAKAPPTIWAFLFVFSLGLSIFGARDIYESLTALLTYIQLLVIFFLIIEFVRGEREIRYLLVVFVLSGVVNAGFGIYQYHFANVDRVAGMTGNANRFGIIQLALLCQIAPFLGATPMGGTLLVLLAVCGLIAYTVLLSLSRGAFIAAAGVILYCFLFLRSGGVRLRMGIVAVAIAALLLAPESFYRRIETIPVALSGAQIHDGSTSIRRLYYRAGIRMGLDHLWTGVGLDQFGRHIATYANLHTVRASSAHNMYVSIFAEAGSIGLIAFLGFLMMSLMAVRGCQRSGWSGTKFEMAFVNSVELGYVALLIGGLFATLEYSKIFWILLALAMVARKLYVRQDNTAPG